MEDNEHFLSRWSRRKLAAKDNPTAAVAAGAPPASENTAPAVRAGESAPAAAAQDVSPEYREFFDPRVEEKLRRSALKQLFSEPQFNVMDGLDTYIDDYSKPDPIPQAMLRQLNQAKELFLFDDEKHPADSAATEAVTQPVSTSPAAVADMSAPPPAAAETAPDSGARAETGSDVTPPAQASRNG